MPRVTFYISEDDKKEWYEKFKNFAGESASSFFVDAIKTFIKAKERDLQGMTEVIIREGEEKCYLETESLRLIKFVGKLLCTTFYDNPLSSGCSVRYRLYLTRKGKLLVYSTLNRVDDTAQHSYEVFDSQTQFFEAEYPSIFKSDALKALPEVEYEELDI